MPAWRKVVVGALSKVPSRGWTPLPGSCQNNPPEIAEEVQIKLELRLLGHPRLEVDKSNRKTEGESFQ